MNRTRLDQLMVEKGIVGTRSQAESYIKLGYVNVDGRPVKKPGTFLTSDSQVELNITQQYVSRAALKLASVAKILNIDFKNQVVLDVGSSTGGFTDYALKHGAKKVIAVDVGSNQLHPSLHNHERIELHENTDIRSLTKLSETVDIVLIDVSFISISEILPHIAKLINSGTDVVSMLKPQFETGSQQLHKGVIKNDRLRRKIMKDFEASIKNKYKIIGKADSKVAGAKGNIERFYRLVRL